MITHFIFLSSSYSEGIRIALDYIVSDEMSNNVLQTTLKEITSKCGSDVSISTHIVHSKTEEWSSVCEADSYFENVRVISNIEEFIRLIRNDRSLIGMDVAKYILSKIACTHLKLQKLVYMCYAEYLCETDKRLFNDEILSFKYGPVADSVYQECKKYKYNLIDRETEKICSNLIEEMPARSRILFAENGIQKLSIIDRTIEKYGGLSAGELVELTHKDYTPWSQIKRFEEKGKYIISDDIIKKFHKFETV